jgi:hypothetical protein
MIQLASKALSAIKAPNDTPPISGAWSLDIFCG